MSQTLVRLRGHVKQLRPSKSGRGKNGKTWTKRTFILKRFDNNQDVFVSTFGKLDNSIVRRDIEFDAEQFNETSYTLKGEISETEFDVNTAADEEELGQTDSGVPTGASYVPPKKRGRPKKAAATSSAGLESVRAEAERVVQANVRFAETQLGPNADKVAVATLAATLQATMATVYINNEKDRRMANFRK